MGAWHMSIDGVGPHHNVDYEGDAERLMDLFIKHMRAKGQDVVAATFIQVAGRDDILGKINQSENSG